MTDHQLTQEAKRSAAWMTFFYIISILGMAYTAVVFLMDGTYWLLFCIGVAMLCGGFLAGTVNLLNWRDMLKLMFEDDEPPDLPTGPPRRESSRNRPRTITINASHDTRRLEVKDANTIYLGDMGLSRSEWHRLTTTLRDNPRGRWIWSRSILQATGIFTGLTVGNRYNDITRIFEDAQAVKVYRDGAGKIVKAHVTNQGIEALHAAAGMRVVTK